MATTSDLSKGQTIKHDGKLWSVLDVTFVSPGKGSAFYKIRLKEVNVGKVVEITLKSGTQVEIIETNRRNVQFLYKEGEDFVFMDDENYEQYHLQPEVVGENVINFLKEEQRLIIFFAEGSPVNITFQKQKHPFKITQAEPGIKGDTATNSNRPVTIETGATVNVPLFINEGDTILVNVETGEYCERVTK
jgi:elongation factor P